MTKFKSAEFLKTTLPIMTGDPLLTEPKTTLGPSGQWEVLGKLTYPEKTNKLDHPETQEIKKITQVVTGKQSKDPLGSILKKDNLVKVST